MDQVDVVAVVGSCVPERERYAARLAALTQATLVSAQRLEAVPDPVAEAVMLAQWSAHPAAVVVELPAFTAMPDVIAAFAEADGPTRLTAVVCVVDAAHLLDDVMGDNYMTHPAYSRLAGRHVAHALLTVTQIEFGSVVVLTNWQELPTDRLSTVMSLVSHLGPQARLRLDQGAVERPRTGVVYEAAQERPGWVALVNGAHDPHMTDPRVSSLRYEHVRPMHPGRLQQVLDERIEAGEFGTVIRSAGFCRFATRPRVVAEWSHVGRMISFDGIAQDDALSEGEELLALGQDLGIIGLDLDHEGIVRALDSVALTDAELAEGPDAWLRFPDPFPAWPVVPEGAE